MDFELELVMLCEKIIDLLEELKQKSLITEEEYINHTKLKFEFLERNLVGVSDYY